MSQSMITKIGASGGRLNRDFWQNNSHRNAWFGGTRILGQGMLVEKVGAPVGNHVFIAGIDAIYQ